MNSKKKSTVFIVQSALIAAAYAAITCLTSPISFGAQQIRISEALTVLPVLTPAAVPGLALGCAIANINSPYGLVDIICGASATLFSALLSRATRNVRIKTIPWLSLLFPVIFNGIIVGAEVAFFLPEGISFAGFLASGGSIALGEALSCFILGIPLFKALDKVKIFR